MSEKSSGLSVFKIASAYIGTVVGAGFASGQEILRFFCAYGLWGLAGILLASVLFFFIGYSVLMLGKNLNARSHVGIVRHTNGRVPGLFIDALITVFLFGGLAAMISGAGAIFQEHFSLSPLSGTLIMSAAALLTVLTGTKGVINAISYVVPFLFVSIMFITVYSFITNPLTAGEINSSLSLGGATSGWLLSAVNYASYNIIVSIAVLAPMGAVSTGRRRLFWGAALGSAGLGLCMAAIFFCLVTNISEVRSMEVPMAEIAGRISTAVKIPFAVVLFGEVYTTAVGNLYGFARRLSPVSQKPLLIVIAAVFAFAAGQLGFSNMVRYFYPVIGYGGMLFFAGVFYIWIFKRRSVK